MLMNVCSPFSIFAADGISSGIFSLDKGQMLEFSTCRYISDDHHIILKGASGNGKTYIACALGTAACRNFIKVRYVRLPDLLNELTVAHGDGTLKKVIKAYQKIDLLILDEACAAWNLNMVDRELLQNAVLHKPAEQELAMTGRDPAPWMLDAADYITEMCCRRHPYEKGIPARKGVEF